MSQKLFDQRFCQVEERVLEELAWSLDSPLWHSLNLRADGVPSSQSVSLGSIEAYSSRVSSSVTLSQRYMQSPIKQGDEFSFVSFTDLPLISSYIRTQLVQAQMFSAIHSFFGI